MNKKESNPKPNPPTAPPARRQIWINVDHKAVPGHVLLTKEDWEKVLDELKRLNMATEFNEEESAVLNHERGTCGNNCPFCSEEYMERLRHED